MYTVRGGKNLNLESPWTRTGEETTEKGTGKTELGNRSISGEAAGDGERKEGERRTRFRST